MAKVLIFSDPKFEDNHFITYRRFLCDKLTGIGHSVRVFLNGPFSFFFALPAIRKADIVFIANFPSLFRTTLVWSRFFKKKVIIKIISDYVWEKAIADGGTFLLLNDFHKFDGNKKGYEAQRRLYQHAQAIVVPSQFMTKVVKKWGVDDKKIKTIRDGISRAIYPGTKEDAKKKIGIPGNLIVSCGPIVNWYGFRMLIKVMPQVLQINQFFRLVIIGSGPDSKALQAMIKNLNLQGKAYLVGDKSKEEVSDYLAAADLFVLNTGQGAFPYSVLEAMAAGVPVITTAVGANLELIKQGENGFMIKYNDEFNLIEAIKTVWQTTELRDRFSEEGRKTAEDFSLQKTIDEMIKIINLS